MRRPPVALFLLLALAAAGAGCASQPTAEQIVERCITARGGAPALAAVTSRRMTGRVVFAGRDSGAFAVEMKRPGMMRQEMNLSSGTLISTLNGERGWAVRSMHGQAAAETLSAGQVRNMQGGADMDGPLVDWKAKGNQVELMGTEKVRGRDAWRLQVTQANGQKRVDFIDRQSNLEVKWEGAIDQGGQPVTFESYFSDYRPVNGVMHAFRIESGQAGKPLAQVLEFDRIDVNVPLDNAEFGPPQVAAPAAASSAPAAHGRRGPAARR
jgi:hypothetical protein